MEILEVVDEIGDDGERVGGSWSRIRNQFE